GWAMTGQLSGVLTVNTDFAETEVDTRQINLTRFPLFYPEKRYFFVEGANEFSFGPNLGSDFVPFFSRRVGLVGGDTVPMDAGAARPRRSAPRGGYGRQRRRLGGPARLSERPLGRCLLVQELRREVPPRARIPAAHRHPAVARSRGLPAAPRIRAPVGARPPDVLRACSELHHRPRGPGGVVGWNDDPARPRDARRRTPR